MDIGNFNIPAFEPPSIEQIEADHRYRTVDRLNQFQKENADLQVFSAISLSAWSDVARSAGVAAVDAHVVCSMPMGVILRSEEPAAGDDVHWQAFSAACAELGAGEMLRWDCCASMDLKSMMHDGGETEEHGQESPQVHPPGWRTLSGVDDPRFMDIVFDFPGNEVAVIKRPWIDARREGSHPVEYRVFVQNGEVQGVANYYLQRGLEPTDEVCAEVRIAIDQTRRLLAHMTAEGIVPFNLCAEPANGFETDKASFTADYLVDRSGAVLFLEAGPPFGLGAHPCAFIGNIVQDYDDGKINVQGVCLTENYPPLPLADFRPETQSSRRRSSDGPVSRAMR